jgi:hypothetical protein
MAIKGCCCCYSWQCVEMMSELQPPTDLFFIPQVIYLYGNHGVNQLTCVIIGAKNNISVRAHTLCTLEIHFMD